MKSVKSAILGIAGLELNDEEKQFFAATNPLGFILFARNCDNPEQVKKLTDSLREVVGRKDVLILIDQEGGRVARLKPPHWKEYPSAGHFAEIAEESIQAAKHAVYNNAKEIAEDLRAVGINVNCVPLADVPVKDSHDIIGDRAFGDSPHQVSILAEAMARGMMDNGVLPVLKHIPGHGRANADSHEDLPIVTASLEELRKSDFVPFKSLAYLPLAMTAHILYTSIDDKLPATLSPKVIELIRNEVCFKGLLMSDDLSMKALKGDLGDLAAQTITAGCDIILHCNGKMSEMRQICDAIGELEAEKHQILVKLLQKYQ
ncbi:MAG: beta-N-acetylhexosaminidase [Pseudomonadota bacterium]